MTLKRSSHQRETQALQFRRTALKSVLAKMLKWTSNRRQSQTIVEASMVNKRKTKTMMMMCRSELLAIISVKTGILLSMPSRLTHSRTHHQRPHQPQTSTPHPWECIRWAHPPSTANPLKVPPLTIKFALKIRIPQSRASFYRENATSRKNSLALTIKW